jgi:glycosyltransferase involved in cell wall biosynthesis
VVVAVSEMVRDELLAIGVPDHKLEVVINGVDTEEYRPGAADRAALGLPGDAPLGLFVGDLRSTIKNLDGVLRALVEVPEAHLAVVGRLDGSPFPALAEELGLSQRVHFLGFRSDVNVLMRAADFFALPSRRDSCPLVLLEALASGLPVLTARTVGTAGLVADGAGVVVEGPDDESTLIEGVRLLVRDPVRRRTMSREARRIAEAHSWDRMAGQYLALIEREVGEPAAAHRSHL